MTFIFQKFGPKGFCKPIKVDKIFVKSFNLKHSNDFEMIFLCLLVVFGQTNFLDFRLCPAQIQMKQINLTVD